MPRTAPTAHASAHPPWRPVAPPARGQHCAHQSTSDAKEKKARGENAQLNASAAEKRIPQKRHIVRRHGPAPVAVALQRMAVHVHAPSGWGVTNGQTEQTKTLLTADQRHGNPGWLEAGTCALRLSPCRHLNGTLSGTPSSCPEALTMLWGVRLASRLKIKHARSCHGPAHVFHHQMRAGVRVRPLGHVDHTVKPGQEGQAQRGRGLVERSLSRPAFVEQRLQHAS